MFGTPFFPPRPAFPAGPPAPYLLCSRVTHLNLYAQTQQAYGQTQTQAYGQQAAPYHGLGAPYQQHAAAYQAYYAGGGYAVPGAAQPQQGAPYGAQPGVAPAYGTQSQTQPPGGYAQWPPQQ